MFEPLGDLREPAQRLLASGHGACWRRDRRCFAGGRPVVRSALYMACLSAVRYNPILKTIYQRLLQAKKPYKVAITAVMRKMIIYLNALLKLSSQPLPA